MDTHLFQPDDGCPLSFLLDGKRMTNRSLKVIFCVFLVGVYAAGYVAVRKAGWVVHRAGFYTDAEQKQRIAGHTVVQGDFGVPALAPKISTVQSVAASVYLPLRWLEMVAWNQFVPLGSEWPADWKLKQSNHLMKPTEKRDTHLFQP
jgi:hypothetical protein